MWVLLCMGVCMYVRMGLVLCGFFSNMYTCIYFVLCCLYCYLEYIISVKHICLLQLNYAHNNMFRFEGVIIRLFVEPYRRRIKYSAYFWIPKSLHLKIHVKLLQY
jgi:hypothetical protein